MSSTTTFLARLFGLYCVIVSACMFLRGRELFDVIATWVADAPLMFITGVLTLFGGLAMVLVHNVWNKGWLACTVSLIGWVTVLKGVLFLALAPGAEARLIVDVLHYREFYYGYASLALLIGLALMFGAYWPGPRSAQRRAEEIA